MGAPMLDTVGLLLVYISYMAFCLRRCMTYLHIFQQEDYDQSRFLRWVTKNKVFDKRLSAALLLTGFFWFRLPALPALIITASCFAVIAAIEPDPRKASKKKLVMTARAKRIAFVTLIILALAGTWWFVLSLPWIWIINVQLIPFILLVANLALRPWENYIQKKLWSEAHQKLKTLNPKVIGITGSYGKTSVKHILGHILKMQAPTLITPGSVNTPMGITRIIREQLDEAHRYFIAEMGAYGPGSIARLCRLAPPDIGIITAIGQAHYERFKSLDTVAEAKFELAESVLTTGTAMIVHENCLNSTHAQKMVGDNRGKFIVCGPSGMSDLIINQIVQQTSGIEVHLTWQGIAYKLTLPLFGLHHGHNAALAFAAAAVLGIPSENIITALKSVPQIQHRLEMRKQPDGSIIIDDAFNSNPEGFRSALELLRIMNGRKILITPGMVELGAAHDEEHEKIGRLAGEVCDVAILVMPERIPTFIKGFKSAGNGKILVEVPSFTAASAWLDRDRRASDVILIENDLPDLYERIPKI
jgi:UDP-N-acetylmuramoyl-tripeptide--D-alanyl-D-alanine ligase